MKVLLYFENISIKCGLSSKKMKKKKKIVNEEKMTKKDVEVELEAPFSAVV
jgi:hypothetical protein